MALINYDELTPKLPEFKFGKAQSEKQTFVVTDSSALVYVENRTDDLPIVWRVSFICKSAEQAKAFFNFCKSVKNGKPFEKSISTDSGRFKHKIKFIEAPSSSRQVAQGMFEYEAVVIASRMRTFEDCIDEDENLQCYNSTRECVDRAINSFEW